MDDLVAELTLRLINETNAGLDQVRADLTLIETEAGAVRAAFGDLAAQVDTMPTGIALEEGLEAVTTEAGLARDAVAAIGTAAEDDIAKIADLTAAWKAFTAEDMAAYAEAQKPGQFMDQWNAYAGGGAPPVEPPVVPPPDDAGKSDKDHAEPHTFGVMDLLAFTDAPEALENNVKFSSALTQITNTKKLYGEAASVMQDEIANNVVMWAHQYHQSSQTLLDAYLYLITTGLSFQQVTDLMPALAEGATAHGIDVSDMERSVYSLADTFQIPPDQMGAMLGRLGAATKMGHFDAASFGAFLPEISGALATAGDTGPDVADSTFAALETIIKDEGAPGVAATDYEDMIHYIGTQHAMRTFMQMSRMMMPQMRDLFDKYGVEPVDLLTMENQAFAEGKDPIQTVLDFVHAATAKMTPTDRNAVISDYFTNLEGSRAVTSLMLNWDGHTDPATGQYVPGYQDDIKSLNNMGQSTLDDDFKAAVQNASGDMNLFAENLAELNRDFGRALNYLVIQPANAIISPSILVPPTGNPNLDGPGPDTSKGHSARQQLDLNLTIKQDGTVVPTTTQPGVNLRVNQGQVLGAN